MFAAGLRKGRKGSKGSKGSISPGRGDEITLTISGPNDLPTYNSSVGPPLQPSVGPPRSAVGPPPSRRTARNPWGRPVGSTRAAGGGGWAAGGGLGGADEASRVVAACASPCGIPVTIVTRLVMIMVMTDTMCELSDKCESWLIHQLTQYTVVA